jgi:hypothetical protein
VENIRKIEEHVQKIIENFIFSKRALPANSTWEENFQIESEFYMRIIPYLSDDFQLSVVNGESMLGAGLIVQLDAYRMHKEKSDYVLRNPGSG